MEERVLYGLSALEEQAVERRSKMVEMFLGLRALVDAEDGPETAFPDLRTALKEDQYRTIRDAYEQMRPVVESARESCPEPEAREDAEKAGQKILEVIRDAIDQSGGMT